MSSEEHRDAAMKWLIEAEMHYHARGGLVRAQAAAQIATAHAVLAAQAKRPTKKA